MEIKQESKSNKYCAGIIESERRYLDFVESNLKEHPVVSKVFKWTSVEEFWRDNQRKNLNLLFLGLPLQNMDGVELVNLVRLHYPKVSIVLITSLKGNEVILRFFKAGVVGYWLKADVMDWRPIVDEILKGGASISPEIMFQVLCHFRSPVKHDVFQTLTQRELQILQVFAGGLPVKKAANTLGITELTLRTHIRNLYRKLNIKSQIELMHKAMQLGYG